MMDYTNGTDIEMVSMVGMHKSAIIYRDDSARFICACFHCGQMFNNINNTLEHIESHFQLTNVVFDQFTVNEKEEKFVDCSRATPFTQSVDIKLEIIDNNEYEDIVVSTKSEPEQIEAVDVKENPSLGLDDQVSKLKTTRQKRESTSRSYRCHKCPKHYGVLYDLTRHLKKHTHDDMLRFYKCKECDCYYKNGFQLRIHVLQAHLMEKKFYCNGCSSEFEFFQTKQFEKHLNWHIAVDKKNLWTNIVDGISLQSKPFYPFAEFEEIGSCPDQLYSCEFCVRQFYIKCNLDVHMEVIHSRQRRLQCGQCDAVFTSRRYYFAHQYEHQRVGSNIVEHDDNVLLANIDACVDERIVHDESMLRCLICNATYELHYDIRSHIRECHVYKMLPPPPMEPKKEFICDICGAQLKTKIAVKDHLMIHTNTRTYPCKFCGKKFRKKPVRTIHERQHTGEKPYQCHQCGKRFVSKGLLTTHQRSHDDSTYPCEVCGKIFNLPSGYRRHVKTHRQDQVFKCTICSKTFKIRKYLTNHMSSHSGKKYKCLFCELIFNSADGRRQHQKNKHLHATS